MFTLHADQRDCLDSAAVPSIRVAVMSNKQQAVSINVFAQYPGDDYAQIHRHHL